VVVAVDPRPALTLTAVAQPNRAQSGGVANYVLSVTNGGSAVARGVVVSVTLPAGFLYQATAGIQGNSTRVREVDPPQNSLLPLWGAWDVPAASGNTPGTLRISFQARILAAVSPGVYSLTSAVTASGGVAAQTIPGLGVLAVGGSTTVPISLRVASTSQFVAQGGSVTYVITLENNSTRAADNVVVTDTLPVGLTFSGTSSISIQGGSAASRLQASSGSGTPQWGPFTIPGGGFSGSTLVITFTAQVSPAVPIGPHPDLVSGSSSNAQIVGSADARPVIVTAA
jgi:uncharacterized repeat protein (TIGR01451 family)